MTQTLVKGVDYIHRCFQLRPRGLELTHHQQLFLIDRLIKHFEELIRIEKLLEAVMHCLVLLKRKLDLCCDLLIHNDAEFFF